MNDNPGRYRLRSLASLAALAIMLAMLAGYTQLPTLGGDDRPGDQMVTPVSSYHELDRLELPSTEGVGSCTRCHEASAHGRNPELRAFLNLHRLKLDCTACHFSGKGVMPHRFDAQGEPSKDQAHRIYAARHVDGRWTPLTVPGDGVQLKARGPDCAECHRRRSPFLSTPGLYERYHRRLYEDLVVLRAMGGRR